MLLDSGRSTLAKTDCLLSQRNGQWTCCACNQAILNIDTCQNLVNGIYCNHVLCSNCRRRLQGTIHGRLALVVCSERHVVLWCSSSCEQVD